MHGVDTEYKNNPKTVAPPLLLGTDFCFTKGNEYL